MSHRTFWMALLALVALCRSAFAWGPEGHQVVGSIADQLLKDHAKQEVARILGFELRVASTWPDCARSVVRHPNGSFEYVVDPRFEAPCTSFAAPSERARLVDYVSRNWSNCTYEDMPTNCHKGFHFADVAIQHDTYDRKDVGTSDHDVVSAINAAVLVLQNKAAPLPFSIKDQKEALFMLAHFVGDLHQPLHVGAIYLDAAGGQVNPDVGTFDKNTETAGGNFISEAHGNLHADWDAIPKRLGNSADQAMVATAMAVPPTAGPLEGWAAVWASDTVMASHTAFNGLSFTGTGAHKWSVRFDDPKVYVRAENQLKEEQLAKGGARLAELLKAIWP
jgi:S1/P1 Nuclease